MRPGWYVFLSLCEEDSSKTYQRISIKFSARLVYEAVERGD